MGDPGPTYAGLSGGLPDRLADERIDTSIALMDVSGQLRFRLELHFEGATHDDVVFMPR